MLVVKVPGRELYDHKNETFIQTNDQILALEHSLLSISKWEAKWHKPFLAKEKKTNEETIDYIRCMTITQNVDPIVYYSLTNENLEAIRKYIEDPMTATTFTGQDNRPSRKIITSEVIYYWMVSFQIPFECQKWHLNRLLTLIRVCSEKNKPPKKMSKSASLKRQHSLNEMRRLQNGSNG